MKVDRLKSRKKLSQKRKSLFDNLFILHLFSTTILFIIIIVSYYYIEKSRFNNIMIEKSNLIHDLLEISCVDPIVGTIAYDRINQTIETLYKKNREIDYIEIYDPTAHIIAFVGKIPKVHLGIKEINLLFKHPSHTGQAINSHPNTNERITFLNVGDQYLGLIRIEFTKKYFQKQLRSNILYFLGFFIIAIAATSLIFYLFTNRWIVLPIINVSRIMKNYGKDELQTLLSNIQKYNQSISKNEIGIMSTAFERMISSIIKQTNEKEKAERALRASQKRFLTVLDSIDATIYVADMETYEVLFMNRYMIESFGRDMTGKICWHVFRGESGPCPHCTNEQLIDENGNPTGVCVWQDKNPVVGKWYVNYDRAIEWTDGRLVKLQIATDITDFKKMEKELNQARKMESIGTLAGGVAHDFNNLLYMIIGNTELALESISDSHPVYTHLDKIKSASFKAAGIVRQLLSFSRRIDQELKPINAVSTIKDALDFLRATIPTTIEIHKHLPDEDITILADPIQINQIMMNLCTNASQAMEETGGILEIFVEPFTLNENTARNYPDLLPGDYLKITLNDTGHGINAKTIDRIFDPYFTTKEIGKGSGMGLAVVHGIVKNHNGAILVDSALGKGTTFTILFPVVDEKPVDEIDTTGESLSGTGKILFVDDDEAITDVSGQMLEWLGYTVEATTKPQEAFELFQSKPHEFDLVITDMTMPQMTGAKLSGKLKDIRPDIPVIICTGHSSLMDEEMARQLGIAAYVMKPVSLSKLGKTIQKVLDT
ncbi:MAG: hypothetical protein DRH34_00025 [Deltaproteobacteria bacterium]|nr:MAG: hypothetical protein DRH34_00025 [Deltaproteobacteria bacterium]